ncbi:UPF0323 family lipoprotein [Helicobacter brantae]|uniref:UPF0323 domain-containing protein n=1 Tax=Helicobacter brantae TaxID=375927 RepID=A0A3D8J3X1_9HELI|nr:UPF0323 family lipoprotein [Helicobacter brantae]RDU72123.1 hypothetical protein CQA58_00525 [Helicobacter brantae]
MNKHFKKISNYAMIGGLSTLAILALNGCDIQKSSSENNVSQVLQDSKKKGAFVILEEQSDGSYKVLEEYPSDQTRIIVKDKNGNERILSQEEVDKLIKEEEKKINNGTSELTNPTGGGLGLGGALLASAAGAILGSYIGNKLFNNPTYQQNQMRNYKSPQAYERSKNSFSNPSSTSRATTSSSGKSGFFGSNSNTRTSTYGG